MPSLALGLKLSVELRDVYSSIVQIVFQDFLLQFGEQSVQHCLGKYFEFMALRLSRNTYYTSTVEVMICSRWSVSSSETSCG